MTIEPTVIHANSTPADVLAAFLPIVEKAFAEPWSFDPYYWCEKRKEAGA